MTNRIKNLLGIAAIVALVVVAYGVMSYVGSYARSITSFRSFSVSAEGKVVAVPDVARFTFGVITQGGTDIASLQEENTTKVNDAILFVKSQGVEDKDIKTESYNVEPRYKSCVKNGGVCPPPEIVGYTVRQTVSVKIWDFAQIGSTLSGIIGHGANSVSRLSFTIDDPTEIENEAREEAIAKAQTKAKAIAEAGGFRIGKLLSVSEGYVSPVPKYAMSEALGRGGGDIPAPVIEPGSQEVIVSVMLRYEIR